MIASVLACPGLRSGVGPHAVRWRAETVPRRSEALGTSAGKKLRAPAMKRVLTTNLRGWRRIRTKVVQIRILAAVGASGWFDITISPKHGAVLGVGNFPMKSVLGIAGLVKETLEVWRIRKDRRRNRPSSCHSANAATLKLGLDAGSSRRPETLAGRIGHALTLMDDL